MATRVATGWNERLARYREKRHFDVTSEPAGTEPPGPAGDRFVVQRHRARRLHYDLRLEVDGVLVSWAVPKGPTLDPDVRRLAVHVEDHPLDYFDFEGVIPQGEYGGGDVIVWDWGTWSLADADDPLEAVEAGSLHFDLSGEKLAGRFALVRRGPPSGQKEQWLLIHKHDAHAVSGWDPDAHPSSVKTGRTNDEVAAAPTARWTRAGGEDLVLADVERTWALPTEEEMDALVSLGRSGTWVFDEHELRLTNLDKVLFPAGRGSPALTKRDLIARLRHRGRGDAAVPHGSADQHAPLPGRGRQARVLAQGGSRPRTPLDQALERTREADPGETERYLVLDRPAAVAWAANFGAIELHPWTSRLPDVHRPTWAMIDIDPGPATTFEDVLVLARLYRVALDHLGVEGCPKVTGQRGVQIWVPVADAYGFDETRAWVEQVSRAIGRTVPELVSWEWERSRREGLIRLDYTQNAINKTLVAPFSARPAIGAPVSVTIGWDELDDPDLRPDRWTITDIADRLAERGDPLLELVGRHQRLPTL